METQYFNLGECDVMIMQVMCTGRLECAVIMMLLKLHQDIIFMCICTLYMIEPGCMCMCIREQQNEMVMFICIDIGQELLCSFVLLKAGCILCILCVLQGSVKVSW